MPTDRLGKGTAYRLYFRVLQRHLRRPCLALLLLLIRHVLLRRCLYPVRWISLCFTGLLAIRSRRDPSMMHCRGHFLRHSIPKDRPLRASRRSLHIGVPRVEQFLDRAVNRSMRNLHLGGCRVTVHFRDRARKLSDRLAVARSGRQV